jgi:hypothetical protein
MRRGDHVIAKIDALPGELQADVRERLRPPIHIVPEALLAAVDIRVRLIGAAVPLHALVDETPENIQFALVEKLEEAATEIHILLRHGLLLD